MRLLLAALLAGAATARAQAAAAPAARIRRISIERVNVFDLSRPREDWWPFRIADRIHVVTREGVIRRELLFKEGGPFDPLRALETERNLRALGFIRSAAVLPTRNPDGSVDLTVRTHDSWTLAPQLSLLTEGGQSSLVAGISEGNLLGTGKNVSFFTAREAARWRNEFRYGDPRFLGTSHRFLGHFASTDRGAEYGTLLNRPFYSYDSPSSDLASWARVQQEDDRYQSSSLVNSFVNDFRAVRGQADWRLSTAEDVVHRAGVGWRYEENRFSALSTTAPGTLPADRTLSGPQLSYALVQPRYYKATDIDRVNVIEDFNLGWELGVDGGPLPHVLGSDRDRWALRGSLQKGLGVGANRFGLVQAVADGRTVHGHLENGILTGSLNMFWSTPWRLRQTLVTHAEYTAVKNLDPERQLNLGGDTGLRGYKSNAFQGARVAIVNLEDRFFFSPDFFHLVYVGAATFIEAGTAIPQGGRFAGAPWKADLGLGLRFSASRGSSGGVLRIDGAYALNHGPGSRWVAIIKGGQAFELGGSANQPLLRQPDAVLIEDSPNERLRRQ